MRNVLCLDRGSSSLKFAAYRIEAASASPVRVARGETVASGDAETALKAVLDEVRSTGFDAVGHRIVFGGERHVAPALADRGTLDELDALVGVEPLHLRAELDLVRAAKRALPGAANVLCFDTAFHRRSPAIARLLPLPSQIDPTLMRYGFHGLSYEYIASQLDAGAGRTIVAHLGSGSSLCAMKSGRPIDTTMGFSVLGGIMMGTRPGDLDPGIILRLMAAHGYDLEKLTDLLYNRSGLLGVSGSSADMRTLIAASANDAGARKAIELFIYRLVKELGALIAVLGGLDTLVFTGGIGENQPTIRAAVARALYYIGVRVDEEANERNERVFTAAQSQVVGMVIPTDENLMIARHTVETIEKVA